MAYSCERKFSPRTASSIYRIISVMSLIFIVYLCAAQVSAAEGGLNEKYELSLNTKITVPVDIIKETNYASLDYLLVNYSWMPKNDYRQELTSYSSNPSGEIDEDNLIIDVKQMNDFLLQVNMQTYTNAAPVEVRNKVAFPLKGVDSRVVKYTYPSDIIDINEKIRNKASELAAGEDDLYAVVFNIADWVNSNVEYNLSSANIDASLPSSWVFENRQGVCDEISNLFISMVRSLGIPARFVSGIAYTDDERFANSWGAHGWAEVYFPGYGWIPFDPTYDQLGYVDATHIKFDDNLEGSKNALQYEWLGRDIQVTSGKISIEGTVLKEGADVQDDFSIEVEFLSDAVDLGSYNVVKAHLKNYRNYYVAAPVAISNTEGIDVISEQRKDILLKPNGEKDVYWIVKTEDNLNQNYIYTFPETIFSSGEEATAKFSAEKGSQYIQLKTAENFIESKNTQNLGPKFECTSNTNSLYINHQAQINCTLGEVPARVCIENQCSLQATTSFTGNINMTQTGMSTVKLSASNSASSPKSYAYLSFNVIDEPNISMKITAPKSILFNEKQDIKVMLGKESANTPNNITVKVYSGRMYQTWNLSSLEGRHEFVLQFYGKNLHNGENTIDIDVQYFDELGYRQTLHQQAEVELYGLTIFQKIYVWFVHAV